MLVMKMPPRRRKKRNFEALLFLLVFGPKFSETQMINEEDPSSSADQSFHSTAFYALRSCHQVLGGDSGHFFSPDYLCSNPALWCNWTIQVHPGKRIHLQLSDLTPDDRCLWRQDQIHIDEPHSQGQKHNILQKCWGEASYTSSSNTVHVVLLIEGSPTPTYRGFHGQYQAFGPPQVYNPHDPNPHEPNSALSENTEDFLNYIDEDTAETDVHLQQDTITEDLFLPDDPHLSASEEPAPLTDLTSAETEPPDAEPELRPSPRGNTAIRRNAEETVTVSYAATDRTTGQSEEEKVSQSYDRKQEEVGQEDSYPNWKQESNRLPEEAERTEPQFDHKADMRAFAKYHNQSPHLPGDVLLEVSVEVNVSRDSQPWNDVAQTLLLSVKTLIKNQLRPAPVSQSISSKRIKRLNAGVLFILWLQMGQRSGAHHTHQAVHSSLLSLIGSRLGFRPNQEDSVIMSLSTADVNECDSQLVLCDPNADCVNHFGSYSCQCREDFQDQSRSGTGTVCVDMKNTGCSASLSSESKAVYVLFFLLSAVVLSLLVLFALSYHRHRRGNFIPQPDPNNNLSPCHHDDVDLPPPPPPRCPPVDLQLLRYNTILSHEAKA